MRPTRGTQLGTQCKLYIFAGKPEFAIISVENGNCVGEGTARARSGAATKFHFPPFPFSANATPRTFYPIFRRYKLILISERAQTQAAKGGRLDLLGFE